MQGTESGANEMFWFCFSLSLQSYFDRRFMRKLPARRCWLSREDHLKGDDDSLSIKFDNCREKHVCLQNPLCFVINKIFSFCTC